MKSPLEQLSQGERELLARFVDTPTYIAFKKLIEIERLAIAKDHVNQLDISNVRFLSGQTVSLKKLIVTLKENYKHMMALEKKKPSKNDR